MSPLHHDAAVPVMTVLMAFVMAAISAGLVYFALRLRQVSGVLAALRITNADAEHRRRTAEAANAAKSNFLAVISHEIRTPLNAVVAAVKLLRRTRLDDDQKAHLRMLSEAGDGLLDLLDDVLDLSKIEAGKMTVEVVPIDLNEMLAGLQTLFWPQAQSKGLTLRTTIDAGVTPEVIGDPLRLRQVLVNLVSNAIKFSDAGVIRIRLRTGDVDPIRLVVEVEDEGRGIPTGDLDRIFQPYEQGAAATSRHHGGSGMGLAISRKLARLMGGDLSVRSLEGEGSCFTLSVPYIPAQPAAPTVAKPVMTAEPGAKIAPVHVLIVDDYEINRRIVSLFIEPLGWAWTMAENGAEAVELCRTRPFDVIVMDMQMPVMDGLVATRTLRASPGPNQATPIVALSANAMDHHRKAWADIGVDDFLTKPVDPEALITTLAYKASGCASAISEVA